jgi:hypothetical protein
MKKLHPEIKALQMVHTAMLLGPLLFLLVANYLSPKTIWAPYGTQLFKTLQIGVILYVFIALVAAFKLFSKRREAIVKINGLNQQLLQYRAAAIIQYAIIESAILFSATAYYLVQHKSFLWLSVAALVVFFTQRPNDVLVAGYLGLKREDVYITT